MVDVMMLFGIDTGHGGKDDGARYGQLVEKDLNLRAGHRLVRSIPWPAMAHHMVRLDDEDMTFHDRGLQTSGCAWTICIHHNASPSSSQHGAEVYVPHGALPSVHRAAEQILQAMPRGLRTRRVIEAYDDPSKHGDEWLQNPANVLAPHGPNAMLVECGYLSNENDAAIVCSDWGKIAITAAILSGMAIALRG